MPHQGRKGTDAFPKPFNEEQKEIIRRLEKEDGVVVQGPPGTGKTHTISNIICHYLATGRRVLVVSHGEAALSVLREQLPEEVRGLAISITTSEREGLKQLEGAIRLLQSIVETLRPSEQSRLIRDLETSIIKMRERRDAIDTKIADFARVQLTEVPGRGISPADLAKAVVANREACSWFDDYPSAFLSETPISHREIGSLRRARAALGKRLEYLYGEYPSVSDLPSPHEMGRIHDDLTRAREHSERAASATAFAPRLTSLEAVDVAEVAADYLGELILAAKHLVQYPWLSQFVQMSEPSPAALPALRAFAEVASELLDDYRQYIELPVAFPQEIFASAEVYAVLKKLSEGQTERFCRPSQAR